MLYKKDLFYKAFRTCVAVHTKLWYNFSTSGTEFLDRSRYSLGPGPTIIVPKHRAPLDYLLAFAIGDPVYTVGKEELFHWSIGWFFHRLGVFPTPRFSHLDTSYTRKKRRLQISLKHWDEALASSRPLLMFPEGTRDPNYVLPIHQGFLKRTLRYQESTGAQALLIPAHLETDRPLPRNCLMYATPRHSLRAVFSKGFPLEGNLDSVCRRLHRLYCTQTKLPEHPTLLPYYAHADQLSAVSPKQEGHR